MNITASAGKAETGAGCSKFDEELCIRKAT